MSEPSPSTTPDASQGPSPDAPIAPAIHSHMRTGWIALLVFVTLGTVLEALHAFKSSAYLGVGNEVDQYFLSSLASGEQDYHFCSESLELEGTFINLATQLSAN